MREKKVISTSQNQKGFYKIRHSEYERKDPNLKQYWKDYFLRLEKDFERKREEYPPNTVISESQQYQRIASKLNLPCLPITYRDYPSAASIIPIDPENLPYDFYATHSNEKFTTKLTRLSFEHFKSTISLDEPDTLSQSKDKVNIQHFNKNDTFDITQETDKEWLQKSEDLEVLVDEEELKERLAFDSIVKKSKGRANLKSRKKLLTKKQNLFLNFLNLPPKKAAKWRPPEESTNEEFDEMTLPEKAAYIEDRVASEFCNWFDSLGGRQSDLNKRTLKELFEIGIVNPATHSMKSFCKELSCLPEGVAIARNIIQESFRAGLRRHLYNDLSNQKIPEKKLAFNCLLPAKNRQRPCKADIEGEWLHSKTVSSELYTYQTVFCSVLHRLSVDAYCHYLLKNPSYVKPDFLIKVGMFDKIQSPKHSNCPHKRAEQEAKNIELSKSSNAIQNIHHESNDRMT